MATNRMKRAVITGAAGGIGIALAHRLSSDGWQLHLCDVNEARLKSMQTDLSTHTTICASLLDSPQACAAALPDYKESFDALVHLAGVFEYHELTPSDRPIYERNIQHNQTNAYDMAVAVEPRMSQHGRIARGSNEPTRRKIHACTCTARACGKSAGSGQRNCISIIR